MDFSFFQLSRNTEHPEVFRDMWIVSLNPHLSNMPLNPQLCSYSNRNLLAYLDDTDKYKFQLVCRMPRNSTPRPVKVEGMFRNIWILTTYTLFSIMWFSGLRLKILIKLNLSQKRSFLPSLYTFEGWYSLFLDFYNK